MTEVTAADFEAHHWQGKLFAVNATVIVSAQNASGGMSEYLVTTSAEFDLAYNPYIRPEFSASWVQLPDGGMYCDAACKDGASW